MVVEQDPGRYRTAGVVGADDEDLRRRCHDDAHSAAVATTTAAADPLMSGYRTLMTATASTSPRSSLATNPGADPGLMPAKLLESMRPTTMAGLAKLVEEVQK